MDVIALRQSSPRCLPRRPESGAQQVSALSEHFAEVRSERHPGLRKVALRRAPLHLRQVSQRTTSFFLVERFNPSKIEPGHRLCHHVQSAEIRAKIFYKMFYIIPYCNALMGAVMQYLVESLTSYPKEGAL